MNRPVILAALMACCLVACNNSSVRRTPSLDAPAVSQQPAPRPGILEQVGDATVRIVQEPARIVSPKKAVVEPPKVYDPPAAMIMRRPWTEPETPETQPEHP